MDCTSPNSSPLALALWMAAAFVSGSAGTLVPEVLLRTPCSVGGVSRPFNAPVFVTSCIFVANLLGLAFELWRTATCGRPLQAPPLARPQSINACVGSSTDEAAIVESAEEEEQGAMLHQRLLPTKVAVAIGPGGPVSADSASQRPLQQRQCGGCATACAIGVPAALNLASCLLQIFSLMLISASTLAGLRGALILFVALLSWQWRLADSPGASAAEWACVAVAAASAALIGAAAAASDGAAASAGLGPLSPALRALVGAAVAVLAYLLAAAQTVAEQTWLDRALSKWTLLGWQGAWGLAGCLAAAGVLAAAEAAGSLPPPDALPLDHPAAVAACLAGTPAIGALAGAYMASSFAFNVCLLELARRAGANLRVVVFTARGALTWAVQVAVYYAAASGGGGGGGLAGSGVPLTPWSGLEAAGFLLLLSSVGWRLRIRARVASAAAVAVAAADSSSVRLGPPQKDAGPSVILTNREK